MRTESKAVKAARAEREKSEAALRHTQEQVTGPLLDLHQRNHFADMIREQILASYRQRGAQG